MLPTAGNQGLPGTGRTRMAKLWTHPLFYRSWIAWFSVALQCLLPKLHTRFCVVSRETDRSVASRQASLRAAGGRCSGPRCLILCVNMFSRLPSCKLFWLPSREAGCGNWTWWNFSLLVFGLQWLHVDFCEGRSVTINCSGKSDIGRLQVTRKHPIFSLRRPGFWRESVYSLPRDLSSQTGRYFLSGSFGLRTQHYKTG